MESSVEAEEWRSIAGYEDLYEVSNFGRVRSLRAARGYREMPKILKPIRFKSGYDFVTLYGNEKPKICKISRLVALAFLPNPDNLPQVNHKDESKANNRLDNLEWCDAKYNSNYGTGIARRAAKHRNCPSISRPINQYSLDGTWITTYPSSMEAHRVTCVNRSLIQMCCAGGKVRNRGKGENRRRVFERKLTAGGFKWQYADINNKKQENKQ